MFNPEEKQIFLICSWLFYYGFAVLERCSRFTVLLFLKPTNKHVATKYPVCAEAFCFKSHLKAIRDFKAKYSTRRAVILCF